MNDLVLKEGRTVFHRHPERHAIAVVVADYIRTPATRRLLEMGVDSWAGLADAIAEAHPDLGLKEMANPAEVVRAFATNYVLPAVVLSEDFVKKGVLTGKYDVNTLRRRYDQLDEIEKDITAARERGAKPSELASLHSIKAKLMQDIDDAMERFNLIATRKTHVVKEEVRLDLTDSVNHLTGARRAKPGGPIIDVERT